MEPAGLKHDDNNNVSILDGYKSEDIWGAMTASLPDASTMWLPVFDTTSITDAIIHTLGLQDLIGNSAMAKPISHISEEVGDDSKDSKHSKVVNAEEQQSDATKTNTPKKAAYTSHNTTKKSHHDANNVHHLPHCGLTVDEVTRDELQLTAHTWNRYPSNQFNLRIGPSYSRNKQKAPSNAALYEPFAMDIVRTKSRLCDAAKHFLLPDTSHIHTHHAYIQPIFVLNIQLSSELPSMFSLDEDGPGYTILAFFRITHDTCQQLKDLETASPAVKLFARYCERSTIDYDMRARFKVICKCDNIEDLGFSSYIQSYNAKPVLINGLKSGVAHNNHERRYFEMDVQSHMFPFIAKQSIQYILSKTPAMLMSIGFTIEGIEDHELPEVLTGCVALNKPETYRAPYLNNKPIVKAAK